jgi:uncharacterized delta-60 repeat protein
MNTRAGVCFATLLSLSTISHTAPIPDPTFGGGDGMVFGPDSRGRPFEIATPGLVVDRFGFTWFLRTRDEGVATPVGGGSVALFRLDPAGVIDRAFGASAPLLGILSTDVAQGAIAVDGSDRVVIAVGLRGRIYIYRFHSNGQPDLAFGAPTIDFTGHRIPRAITFIDFSERQPVLDMAVQADGKIVVVTAAQQPGTDEIRIALARLQESGGALDPTFGAGGKVFTAVGPNKHDIGSGVRLRADGRILVTGYSLRGFQNDAVVLRYLENGSLDPTFGTGGAVFAPRLGEHTFARRLAIDADGGVVVAGALANVEGSRVRAGILRVTPIGTIDPVYGPTGWSSGSLGANLGDIREMALQPDRKPVLVGYRDFQKGAGSLAPIVLRFLATGEPDPDWGASGIYEVPLDALDGFGVSVAAQGGRIAISGTRVKGGDEAWFVTRLIW